MCMLQEQGQASKLIVICLEGCHGAGKTSLCGEFQSRGYRVLDEAFIDMPSYSLDPQSLLMETFWVCSWFTRILQVAGRYKEQTKDDVGRAQVVCVDRSPFSAVFYSNNGHLLEPIIREQMREVQAHRSIQFYTVHINVEPEILWQRICSRLEEEPERMRFNEQNRSWMDKTLAFYNSFAWDFTVQNDQSLHNVVRDIECRIGKFDRDFQAPFARNEKLKVEGDSSLDSDADTHSEWDAEEHSSPFII